MDIDQVQFDILALCPVEIVLILSAGAKSHVWYNQFTIDSGKHPIEMGSWRTFLSINL